MAENKGLGLKKETAAALSVLLAPTIVGTLFFLFVEKDPFVRFYSIQIILVGLFVFILQTLFSLTGFLLSLAGLVGIAGFIVWLILIYKAWQGEEWRIPFIGDFSKQLVKRMS